MSGSTSFRFLVGLLFLPALTAAGCSSQPDQGPVLAMPSFTLSTPDGETRTLDDLLGEVTLVDFFFPT